MRKHSKPAISSEQSDHQNDESSSSNSSLNRTFTLNKSATKLTEVPAAPRPMKNKKFTHISSELNSKQTKKSANPIQDGIMGYMDRELNKPEHLTVKAPSPHHHSLGRQTAKAHHKRDKSGRRKSKQRDHKTIDDIEAQAANENILKYLKQCSMQNEEEQLTGNLEIADEASGHRPGVSNNAKATRCEPLQLPTTHAPRAHGSKRKPKRPPHTEITAALQELSDDVVLANEEIYNPFTPVVSPTEGCPARGSERIYVQTDRGFRAVSKDKACGRHVVDAGRLPAGADRGEPAGGIQYVPCGPGGPCDRSPAGLAITTPLSLALLIQNFLIRVGLCCHGLLAGLALCHIVLVITMNLKLDVFPLTYSQFAFPYVATFHFLCAICLVSAYDRYDVSHLDINHVTDLVSYRKSAIIVPIYFVTMILSLYCAHMDDRLHLQQYGFNSTNETVPETLVQDWKSYSMYRSSGPIIAWAIMVISGDLYDDMFYTHLINLNKYQR